MVKHFTIANWNQEGPVKNGNKTTGILIGTNNPFPDDTIIQVYKKVSEDKHMLLSPPELFIGFSSNEIAIMSTAPFDGKVVIK